MITRSASRSAEQQRGRVRVVALPLRAAAAWGGHGWMVGQFQLSDPNTLVPRSGANEDDVLFGVSNGKTFAIVRDYLVGTYELLVRMDEIDETAGAMHQLVQAERVRAATISIPASMHDVLMSTVRHHMGEGLLYCVAFAGMGRGPSEHDYYTFERVLDFMRRLFESSLGEQQKAEWRSLVEVADEAFRST